MDNQNKTEHLSPSAGEKSLPEPDILPHPTISVSIDGKKYNLQTYLTALDAKTLRLVNTPMSDMPSLSLDFIPETDKKVLYVDGDSIKSICSGLECELAFCDIQQSEEAQKIQTLALEVESLIKKHRLGASPPLSKKSYDKIFGDIKHWGMATADSIIELYHKHQIAMSIICRHIGADITDDDIEKFIKYRNDITHGSYRVNNIKIAQTAYALECLVYCCLLSRIGEKEDKIEDLCKNKIGK